MSVLRADRRGLETPARITKMLKSLAKSGKIPARGTTPGRVLENSLARGLNEEFEIGGPLRTTRNVRPGRA